MHKPTSILGRIRKPGLLGYSEFKSPIGISGMCRVDGRRVQFLAVDSIQPGNGLFRDFIIAVKKEFDRIDLMFVESPILLSCLPRYGFKPYQERQFLKSTSRFPELSRWEHVEGYRWDK
jgi:hypothetical protein